MKKTYIFILLILLFSTFVFATELKPVDTLSVDEILTVANAENILKEKFNADRPYKELKVKDYAKIESEDVYNIDLSDGTNFVKLKSLKNLSSINKIEIKKNDKYHAGSDILTINEPNIENSFVILEKYPDAIGKDVLLLHAEDDINFEISNIFYEQNDTHIWFNTTDYSSWSSSYSFTFFPEVGDVFAISMNDIISGETSNTNVKDNVYDECTSTFNEINGYVTGTGTYSDFETATTDSCFEIADIYFERDSSFYGDNDLYYSIVPVSGYATSDEILGSAIELYESSSYIGDFGGYVDYDPDYEQPIPQRVSVSSITYSGATLTGKVDFNDLNHFDYQYYYDADGDKSFSSRGELKARFEYSTDSGLAGYSYTSWQSVTHNTNFNAVLSTLSDDTTYYYRVVFDAIDPTTKSSAYYESTIGSFTTLSGDPSVSALAPNPIADTTATLRGVTTFNSYSGSIYGVIGISDTSGSGYDIPSTPFPEVFDGTTFTRDVTGLDACTDYYVRTYIYSDSSGSSSLGFSDEYNFKTSGCTGGEGNIIFEDTFDRSNSGTIGNEWAESELGTGYCEILSNELHCYSLDTSNYGRIERSLSYSGTTVSNLIFEWDYEVDNTNAETVFRLYTGSNIIVYFSIYQNYLKYYDGSWNNLVSASTSTLYNIKIKNINLALNTYTISIDDTDYDNIPFYQADTGNPDKVLIGNLYTSTSQNSYWDYFRYCDTECIESSEPPTVLSDSVDTEDITYNSAILSGIISNMGDYDGFPVFFRYKMNSTSTWTEDVCEDYATATGYYYCELTDLDDDTLYDWQFYAIVEDTEYIYSAIRQFTTATITPPTISTDTPINISLSSATLRATISDFGDFDSLNGYFRYRETEGIWSDNLNYLNYTTTGQIQYLLTGLDTDTEYEFAFFAEGNFKGVNIYSGGSRLFNTTNYIPPQGTILTPSDFDITESSISVSGIIDTLGSFDSVIFFYRYALNGTDIYSENLCEFNATSIGYLQDCDISGLTNATAYEIVMFAEFYVDESNTIIAVDSSIITTDATPSESIEAGEYELFEGFTIYINDPYLFSLMLIQGIILICLSFSIVLGLKQENEGINRFFLYFILAMSIASIIYLYILSLIPIWQLIVTIFGIIGIGLYGILSASRGGVYG